MSKTPKTQLAAELEAAQKRLTDAAAAVKSSNTQELRDEYSAAWAARETAATALKGKPKSFGGGSRIGRARVAEEAAQLRITKQRSADLASAKAAEDQRNW
jgi:hypothetical protein